MGEIVELNRIFCNVAKFGISLAAIATLLLSGCGGGGGSGGGETHTLTGAMSGATLAGVTLNLTGIATKSTTSDANGNYSFAGLSNGSYTVTPIKTGYSFSPAHLTVTISGANINNINFTATANVASAYTLSGSVTGAVVQSVLIILSGSSSATTLTDANGNYSFSGLANGSYTVIPSKTGYTFNPNSNAVTISGSNISGNNFTATANVAYTNTLSGTVTGAVVQNVLITMNGAPTHTDPSGHFSFTGVPNGTFTATPTLAGYTFSPTSNTVTVYNTNATFGNFVSTAVTAATYSISGAVSGATSAGVTINLTGAATASATSDANGNYSFAGLANGSYTVTPSKTGYTFNPINTAISVSGANVSGKNFTANDNGVPTFTLSGTVTGAVLQNALITLSGANSGTTLTNASGYYSFSGLADGSYTVTPSKTGYSFSPTGNAVTISGANATVSNFFSTFSVATVADPLASQQWGLCNTGQTGFADTSGIANSGGMLGTDINVDPVYSAYGYTGREIVVAVVDTGLEIAHEDINANVVPGGSWNFYNGTTDPTSPATAGDHGTKVGGLIAMSLNGVGGIGVAPNARLKGFNYLTTQTIANRIASLGGSTASPNSSDVAIFNQSSGTLNTVDFPVDATVEAQFASGTSTLRGGKGALYVRAAGNGFNGFGTAAYCSGANSIGVSCQNASFDPYNTLPYNIVMAALNAKGQKSSYSTAGAAVWGSTPGGESGYNSAAISQTGHVAPAAGNVIYDPAMVTTDQSGCAIGQSVNISSPTWTETYSFFNWGGTNAGGANANCNYTNGMSGTSSAAPMMSGVIALILEANPALTWREVKDILAKTAVQVDSSIAPVNVTLSNGTYVAEQGWVTNAAGYKFHNWYGFGAVNAGAAVTMAQTYTLGSLGTFATTGWISSGTLGSAIPDNSIIGVSVPLTVTMVGTGGIVEAVQIKVTTAGSGYTGDLGIEITSPSGTKSILKTIRDGFNGSYLDGMVLASNTFYGETSTGTWTVKVVDGWASYTQMLTNVQIRIYGH